MEVIIALMCASVTLLITNAMLFVLGLLIYHLTKPQSEISEGKHTTSMTDQSEPEDITETQTDPMYEAILQEKPATVELIAYAPLTQ